MAYLQPPTGHNFHPLQNIVLNQEKIDVAPKLVYGKKHQFAPPLEIDLEANRGSVLKAVNALFAADNQAYELEVRRHIVQGLLDRFELNEFFKADKLLRHSTDFLNFLKKKFPDTKLHRQYPLKTIFENRHFETTIDFLLLTDNKLTIIQISSYSGNAKGADKRVNEMKDWLFLVGEGMKTLFPDRELEIMVGFPLLGVVVFDDKVVKI